MTGFVGEREIDVLLKQLTRLRAELSSELGQLSDDKAGLSSEKSFDISSSATQFSDYHKRIQMVDEALRKIESDEYGVCESCQGAVSLADLQQKPYCRYCIQCRTESGRS